MAYLDGGCPTGFELVLEVNRDRWLKADCKGRRGRRGRRELEGVVIGGKPDGQKCEIC